LVHGYGLSYRDVEELLSECGIEVDHASIFPSVPWGPGRTTNPKDFRSLMDDLEANLFERLPDATWFYPGHGEDSTLGGERPAIPQWRARGW
jgi:glyoxylase-like metal-dependent hydrolase (beta-lactamase superfamily II)